MHPIIVVEMVMDWGGSGGRGVAGGHGRRGGPGGEWRALRALALGLAREPPVCEYCVCRYISRVPVSVA